MFHHNILKFWHYCPTGLSKFLLCKHHSSRATPLRSWDWRDFNVQTKPQLSGPTEASPETGQGSEESWNFPALCRTESLEVPWEFPPSFHQAIPAEIILSLKGAQGFHQISAWWSQSITKDDEDFEKNPKGFSLTLENASSLLSVPHPPHSAPNRAAKWMFDFAWSRGPVLPPQNGLATPAASGFLQGCPASLGTGKNIFPNCWWRWNHKGREFGVAALHRTPKGQRKVSQGSTSACLQPNAELQQTNKAEQEM